MVQERKTSQDTGVSRPHSEGHSSHTRQVSCCCFLLLHAVLTQRRTAEQRCGLILSVSHSTSVCSPDCFFLLCCSHHAVANILLRATPQAHVMVASHNESTVRFVTGLMSTLSRSRSGSGGEYFGQLLGMCDHVSSFARPMWIRMLQVCALWTDP